MFNLSQIESIKCLMSLIVEGEDKLLGKKKKSQQSAKVT